jgi:polyhydroxybutyrate depolymerase
LLVVRSRKEFAMTSVTALLLLLPLLPSQAEPEKLTLDVNGIKREALVVLPTAPTASAGAPLIFAFHGHGGTARNSLRNFALHKLWPEAIVVYMQGLPGVKGSTDPDGKKAGWQRSPGELENRDLKFFDAALKEITSKNKVNTKRIYAMGHSNGSRFVCVLMNKRGETFAACATSGGQGGPLWRDISPIPLLAIAGEKDPLVPFAGQKLSIEALAKSYQVDPAKTVKHGLLETMTGKDGIQVCTYFHPGGHEWTKEMNTEIVGFFKQQEKK